MDAFANETADVKAEAFRETAARMGIQPVIVEKDFWVCWTLKHVFSLDGQTPGLLFKGGTSLSKAYGAIRRFSEDIDLSLDRRDLGFSDERDPASDISNKKRKSLLAELETAAVEAVAGPVASALKSAMSKSLKAEVELSVDDQDAQTLLFEYPPSLKPSEQSAYIKPAIRLEFGARSDRLPAEAREISSFVHEQFPDLISSPTVTVNTLAAERTFWEKATILHMLHHRDPDKPLGERMSRHYYDIVQLSKSAIKEKALANLGLLDAVAQHKAIFFKAAEANYEAARPPTLKLSPGAELEKALRADYSKMAEMLFDEPEPIDDLLKAIAELEAEVNALPVTDGQEKPPQKPT